MAKLQILEGNGYRLHLKILFESEAIVIVRFEKSSIDHLKRTIEEPVPVDEASEDQPLEVVVEEDDSKWIVIDLPVGEGSPIRIESPVDSERDLYELYETIRSPQPFRVRRKPLA